ncbi:hypothetical protein Metvu_0569 [Methanocaldococcus vulcanius M7]|uniref:Uncharacterized protein n=1 Tax=Methanocaldococcus vulcanius (strain ATCC 700851 / DSM 12094 / M7) TaxID=579137 RepID=C9RFS6_METVM|nr:hypothetical protein [Methanocaldococcus vulcanius]ACX72428.1 hypothetical protein Metvu_0569 [Methanocaldococcus vulcanius M7]
MAAVQPQTKIMTIENVSESDINGLGSVEYQKKVTLDNGNICSVEKIEYYRTTQKLIVQYKDDTDVIKDQISRINDYQNYKTTYEQTGSVDALALMGAISLEFSKDYGIAISDLISKAVDVLNYWNNGYSIEDIAKMTGLDETKVKTILVLNGKLTITW